MKAKRPPRILIIEDDRRLLGAIVERLEMAGYECVFAGRGDEGLTEYSHTEIDLIITDLNMPGLDGIGLIRLIRTTSDVPIIIVTGKADSYREAMGMLHNVTLVSKPFEPNVLLNRVSSELNLCGMPNVLLPGVTH